MTSVRVGIADGRQAVWTRDTIIQALRDYAELYGPEFTTAAFNPATAHWRDRPDLKDRYYAGNLKTGKPWPSLNTIKSACGGSFNAAREAAGLAPNRPGPAPGHKRRPDGEFHPIRDVRIERVYVQSEVMEARDRRVENLQKRLRAAEERAVVALERMRRVEAERPRVERPRAEVTKTKTVTKTVKVRDERALERARAKTERVEGKLADEQAARRATEDQLKVALRDRDTARRQADARASELAVALADAKSATEDAKRASDRLAAAQARIERLSDGLEHARSMTADAAERATASQLVREAEQRAEEAELRAARAERVAAEHAAAVTGQMRQLTSAELNELRRRGPAGPVVMAAALKKLSAARAMPGAGKLDAALTEVARAALGWKDRL